VRPLYQHMFIPSVGPSLVCIGPHMLHICSAAAAGDAHLRPVYQHMFVPSVGPSLAFIGLPWCCACATAAAGEAHVRLLYRHISVPSVGPSLAFIGLPWRCAKIPQFQLLLLLLLLPLLQMMHTCGRCTSTCSFHQLAPASLLSACRGVAPRCPNFSCRGSCWPGCCQAEHSCHPHNT
jgi:hypothetical protein